MAQFEITEDGQHIEAKSSFIHHYDGPAALTDLFECLLEEADTSTPMMHLTRLEGLRWRTKEMLDAVNERIELATQRKRA